MLRYFHCYYSRLLPILNSLSIFLQLSLSFASNDICITLGQVGHVKTSMGLCSAWGSGFKWLVACVGSPKILLLQKGSYVLPLIWPYCISSLVAAVKWKTLPYSEYCNLSSWRKHCQSWLRKSRLNDQIGEK